MNNQTLFRVGGIVAILSAVSSIAFPILFFSGSESLATAALLAGGVTMLILLIPLSLDLSAESLGLAIAAALLIAGTTIWAWFLDPVNVDPPVFGANMLLAGLGFALYGWLQYRSGRYPSGLGIVGMLLGVSRITSGAMLISGADIDSVGGIFIPIISVLFIVYLFWLGWYYLRGRSETLATA